MCQSNNINYALGLSTTTSTPKLHNRSVPIDGTNQEKEAREPGVRQANAKMDVSAATTEIWDRTS